MKYRLLILMMALPPFVYGQTITPVHGDSWIGHIHRPFDQTSMGKSSGVYGPKAPMPGDTPPPDPHLSDPEVRSLLAYLRQLAGIPGAEKQQVPIHEPPLRAGEHIVKSTCHICHGAVGHNPTPEEILRGQIPPLSSLTSRLSLNDFLTKVVVGRPVLEGPLAMPMRGHMPAFNYLRPDEAADVYFYLLTDPPQE